MREGDQGMKGKPSVGAELTVAAPAELASKFFGLLQSGFRVKAATGVSVREFLCGQLGLSEAYVEDRVQTLFLDSKPVDDITTARIADGSRLALSAAMPGVAGALFRKGGRYGAMRRGISYGTQDAAPADASGWVTVKLFNMVLRELGGFFLERGVWLEGRTAREFFAGPPQGLLAAVHRVVLNGEQLDPDDLATREWPEDWVFIRVSTR